MPFLTIFTAPKPFTDPHIAAIQTNAIRSWLHLGLDVHVILIGQENGLAEAAALLSAEAPGRLQHLPAVQRNASGTPLVSSIFDLARSHSTSPCLAYVNADILLLPEFLTITRQAVAQAERFLLVGQRWDLDMRASAGGPTRLLEFSDGWADRLRSEMQQRARLHPPAGSDYFIFPRSCFERLPAFAIGRAGWDNWMFFHARQQRWPVIDASQALPVIHQDHDYSHLPGGQPHYRLPETAENIRLAGGRRAIFTLLDADFHAIPHIQPIPLRGPRLWRAIETYPLLRLHSYPLAELFFAIFHPRKAWGEWRGRLQYALRPRR